MRPIDDTFFRKLAERKEFCEELLQVILKKPELKLIETIPQRSFHNLDGCSVTVDVICKDSKGCYYSTEMQKTDNDDHLKRVRYNRCNVDIYISEKGTKFRVLPDVYMIYISSFDPFKMGKTLYHVTRTLEETGRKGARRNV